MTPSTGGFWDELNLGGVIREGFSKTIDTVQGAYLARNGVMTPATPVEQFGEQLPPAQKSLTMTTVPAVGQAPQAAEKESVNGVLVPKQESSSMMKVGAIIAAVVVVALLMRKKG